MTRRCFLALAASQTVRAVPAGPVRITRITYAPIDGRYHKFVTMNAVSQRPAGHTYVNHLVRIVTDQGMEGVGVMDYDRPSPELDTALKSLIGADPLVLYEMQNGRITGRNPSHAAVLGKYRHLDGPLFDLIGKLQQVPAWKLIGPGARSRVESYDATVYFSDLWFRDRGVRAVIEEVEEAAKKGYRGVKIKTGRGLRWMDSMEAGNARDLEVLRAARRAVGPNFRILTDANNGYRNNREAAWRFLDQARELNLYWFEEPLPETVADYTWLKDRMEQAGMRTLLADGENFRQLDSFRAYLQPRRLIDALQLDIRRGGFVDCAEMARMGLAAGAVALPHNWGSQVGALMNLHMSRALENVVGAEDDRSTCDVILAEGYVFRDGLWTLPDAPGLGIAVDEKTYRSKYQAKETVIT